MTPRRRHLCNSRTPQDNGAGEPEEGDSEEGEDNDKEGQDSLYNKVREESAEAAVESVCVK